MTTQGQPAGRGRWVTIAAAVAAAVLGAAAVAVPLSSSASAQEADRSRPDVFRSSAASVVMEASLDREALLPLTDVFRFMALEGWGTYESSNQTAQASLLYPGNGVISGPNLLCDTFGGQFPPEMQPVLDACLAFDFPLSVRADSLEPQETSTGATQIGERGDSVSAEATRAVARADVEATTTDAVLSSLHVLGLPAIGSLDTLLPLNVLPVVDASVVTIDGATSRTNQRIDDEGTLVVEAESTLSGLRLVGGLVEIGSLDARAVVTDDGRGAVTQHAELDIGAVTVAGIPAGITENGLELGSPTGLLAPLVEPVLQLVNDLLAGLGISIRALDVDEGIDEHGSSFARVGGVLIEYGLDVAGLPTVPGPLGEIDLDGLYQGSIALGQAAAVGQAAYIGMPPFEPGPPITPVPDDSDGAAAPPPPPPAAATPPPGPPPSADTEIAAPTAAPEFIRVLAFDHLAEGRFALAYLAFVLVALATCIAPRFVVSARLPGADQ